MLSNEVKSVHFIGICGTAMAGVAAMCRELGYTVTGSDENVYPPMSTFLETRGIRIVAGYRGENLDHRPDLIVIGNAMKRGNPEVERILDEQLNYCSLPDLVREFFLRGRHNVVVAGTHGKTTTTSLLAWVLESAGCSPSFLIGGIPNNFGTGARLSSAFSASCGSGLPAATGATSRKDNGIAVGRPLPQHPDTSTGIFVIEGDEYDTAFFDKRSKFVHYLPDTAILNNLEFDHADIFADLAAVKRSFRQLVAVVPRRGLILANGDDASVREVVAGSQSRVRFFTLADFAGYTVPLAGAHNQMNAAAAAVCCAELGLTREQIQRGFDTFTGVKRRMEVRGEAGGVTVIDDFAHHPTALVETIKGLRQRYPGRRLWALFEPRSNTTRRNIFQRELTDALALADGVFVARVDRLNELPAGERLEPERLIADLRAKGLPATYGAGAEEIVGELAPQLRAGDVVAVFSNGGFGGIHDKLLKQLQ